MQFSLLKTALPANVHLLTLKLADSTNAQTLLLRLEHQFEVDEAPWDKQASVSLAVCYAS